MTPLPRLLPLCCLFGAVMLSACDLSPRTRAATADSLAAVSQRLAEAEHGVQQRDALMLELAQTARIVNEIDSSLSVVKGLKLDMPKRPRAGQDDPWSARHDSLLAKVAGVTRLLEQSRGRVTTLTRANSGLETRLRAYKSTIEQLETTVERQRGEIATFAAMVDSLRYVEARLAMERDATRDSLQNARNSSNTVYYVVGRRSELVRRAIASSEGSRKLLLVGSRTLVPARELDPADFTRADQRQELVITLPNPGERYRVVSRHDPALLAEGHHPDGTPNGTLRVTDPARFWAASKYLIIAQN